MKQADLPKKTKKKVENKGEKAFSPEDKDKIVLQIIKKEADDLLNYLNSKITTWTGKRENLSKADKELIFNCLRQNFQRILELYPAQENNAVQKHSKRDILQMLPSGKGSDKSCASSLLDEKNSCFMIRFISRDNKLKPKTVFDVKLSINVCEADLIHHTLYSRAKTEYIISLICERLRKNIDNVFMDDLLNQIPGICNEIDKADFNIKNLPEKIYQGPLLEKIRDKGFNTAINSLSSMLKNAGMDFQYIDIIESSRKVFIREYEDTYEDNQPDENFMLHLKYLDKNSIVHLSSAYNDLHEKYYAEVCALWDLLEIMYQDAKPVFKSYDYSDLLKKYKSSVKLDNAKTEYSREKYTTQFFMMRDIINKMRKNVKSGELDILENHISKLEKKSLFFDELINPQRLQSGFFIDLGITSIKRKNTTISQMAGVLNEFIDSLPGYFLGDMATEKLGVRG